MNAKAAFLRPGLGAIVCVLASTAADASIASPTYGISSLDGFSATLFQSYSTTGNAATTSTSLTNSYLKPDGVPSDGKYVYTSPPDGAIEVTNLNAPSFSFLWGTPDAGNTITYHTSLGDFVYSGANLIADFGDVNRTIVFTASFDDAASFNAVTFTSTNVAFEIDGVQRVPEPGSIALVSAALGALAWTGRRRKA